MKKTLLLMMVVLAVLSFHVRADYIVAGVRSDTPPSFAQPSAMLKPIPLDQSRGTLIDFDEGSQPCVFAETMALRHTYSAQGVLFEGPAELDGGGVLDECGNFGVYGHSSPNFLAFNPGSSFQGGGIPQPPETILFNPPVTVVSFIAAAGAYGALTATAYDSDDNPLDSVELTLTYNAQSVTLTGEGIAYVVVDQTDQVSWILDNLYFETDPMPTATPTSAPDPTGTPACIHDGDANLDGSATAGDAQLAFLIALGSFTPTYEEECAADCNGDWEITAGDAQAIFLMALGSGSCADPL